MNSVAAKQNNMALDFLLQEASAKIEDMVLDLRQSGKVYKFEICKYEKSFSQQLDHYNNF